MHGYIRKASGSFWSVKKSSFMIAIIAFFIWSVAFVILGPIFTVKTIYISREDNIININSSYSSVEYIRWKNILFLDTSNIAERLQKNQKSIQNLEFQVDFPSTLNITLKSYPVLFQSKGNLILSNGVIVAQESNRVIELPEIWLSKDVSELVLFSKSLPVKEIRNISLIMSELQRNIPGINIEKSKYYITEKELILSSQNGNLFVFDISGNLKDQIQKLAIFQKEQTDISEKKYIYIDVRIPQKLFLCWYEEEYSCRNNLKKIYDENIFEYFSQESS